MTEDNGKTRYPGAEGVVTGYQDHLEKPELRQKLVDNEAAFLVTDEIIEGHAKRLDIDPEELKKLVKKPQ